MKLTATVRRMLAWAFDYAKEEVCSVCFRFSVVSFVVFNSVLCFCADWPVLSPVTYLVFFFLPSRHQPPVVQQSDLLFPCLHKSIRPIVLFEPCLHDGDEYLLNNYLLISVFCTFTNFDYPCLMFFSMSLTWFCSSYRFLFSGRQDVSHHRDLGVSRIRYSISYTIYLYCTTSWFSRKYQHALTVYGLVIQTECWYQFAPYLCGRYRPWGLGIRSWSPLLSLASVSPDTKKKNDFPSMDQSQNNHVRAVRMDKIACISDQIRSLVLNSSTDPAVAANIHFICFFLQDLFSVWGPFSCRVNSKRQRLIRGRKNKFLATEGINWKQIDFFYFI